MGQRWITKKSSLKLRDAQTTASLDRARIFLAGTVIVAKTPEEGRRMVDKVADTKPNFIKIRVDDKPRHHPENPSGCLSRGH
jgi:hypothetical protein